MDCWNDAGKFKADYYGEILACNVFMLNDYVRANYFVLQNFKNACRQDILFLYSDYRNDFYPYRNGDRFGVLYPNFKEDNPSKIVSGFGVPFVLF
jgi:hypothetical protein